MRYRMIDSMTGWKSTLLSARCQTIFWSLLIHAMIMVMGLRKAGEDYRTRKER